MKNLPQTLTEELAKAGLAATIWAESCGLNRSQPTALKDGRRADVDTLYKIVHGWKQPIIGLRCAQAHLLDELERMGLTPDQIKISIVEDTGLPDAELEASLKILEQYIRKMPNLRTAIKRLATTLPAGASNEAAIDARAQVIAGKMSNKATKRPA